MLRLLALFLLSASLCAPSLAHAQTWTAGKISFNHLGDFTQQQLEDVAGIHPGTSFTTDDLSKAAQKLADTGFFDNIGVTLDGPVKSITVLFDISPTDHAHMLRVGFENFIWLTPAEVTAAVRSQSPLFSGYLPENDALEDSIASALAQALAAKGINAKVQHETSEPTLGHPLLAIEFRITSPRPRVANIKLSGVSSDLVPLVQKSINLTAKTNYNDGLSGLLTSDRILSPLLDAGYVRATLSGVSIARSAPDAGITPVVVSATLDAGELYHLSTLNFAGTPMLSADDFFKTAKLHPGDLASHQTLLETLTPLDNAYRRLGYMDVVIQTNPVYNTAAHNVAYTITVVPGEQYHLHEVSTHNLDPVAIAEFDRSFALHQGQLFNPIYVTDFLKNQSSLKALSTYSALFKASAYPSTHTVDLDITFFRGPTVEVQ
jgi:outer membrane protein insertion porin family